VRVSAGGVPVIVVTAVLGAAVGVLMLPASDAAFTATATSTGNAWGVESSFYRRTIKDDNPTAYYRLNEANRSTVVADLSGNNHPGSYIASPVLGATGMSHDSDTAQQTGANSWGQVPNLVSANFTLELWFKTTASSSVSCGTFWGDCPYILMGNMHYTRSAGNFGISMDGTGTIWAGTGDNNASLNTISSYNDGAWHHVAFTRTQSTGAIKLYVDGALKDSGTGGTGADNDSTNIGVGANVWGYIWNVHPFNGYLDDVAEYTTALSGTRVSAHYSARNAGYVSAVTADTPAGYWRLDDTATSGTLTAVTGGAAAAGGMGGEVMRGQAGAIGDGNAAMRFVPDPPGDAYVPRLVSGTFTLEARFRTTQDSGGTTNWYNSNRIFGAEVSGSVNDFGVGIGADGRVYAGTGNPETTLVSAAGPTYNDGNWHQVDFTRVGGTGALKLYVDGTQVATGTGGTQALTASSTLRIGSDYSSNMYFEPFDGVVSDVAQYSTTLGSARVSAHVAASTSAAAYHAAVSADSPVGYWPLNDTTGTTLAALIGGAANNGYADAGLERSVSGPTGAGMYVHRYNISGAEVPRTVQTTFSLECWFQTNSGTGYSAWYDGSPIIQGDVNNTAADYGLSMTGDGELLFGASAGAAVVQSAPGYNDGAWHHVVVTRNSVTGAVVLYLDGAQAVTGTGITGTLNAANVIGLGYNPNNAETFEGTVDEVAFYSTILTAAQVAAHHTRGVT
jgi:Concanavalin A-like lectin/glucanases superfamily